MGGVFHLMKSIDFLEHGGGGLLVVHRGEHISLPNPQDKHYQWVLMALHAQHVPGTPGDIPEWKRALVFDRWAAAWDLPDFSSARRLAYLVDHYRPAISHDLATWTHYDLGNLWRTRRWTLLLDIVDRLPAHSQYASTVSMDKEHAEMMAESLAARKSIGDERESSGPSLSGWTPEVAVMTSVLDAVRNVQYTLVAVNSERGKMPSPPEPAPRPITPLESAMARAEYNLRKAKHEALVARVLAPKA